MKGDLRHVTQIFLLGEMTLLQARVEMFFRFVRKRCAADIEVNIFKVFRGSGLGSFLNVK